MIEIDAVERHLFLEGIFLRYGYDFRQYAEASLNRRLAALMQRYDKQSLLDLMQVVLSSSEVFREILPTLTIGTTEFFRDPLFFKSLKDKVFPVLATYPSLNIWIAGCSTGEEIISLAILLRESDLLRRTTIYATDINPLAIKKAQECIYDLHAMRSFSRNYTLAGGQETPTNYFTVEYGLARFDKTLRENVVFSEHNLVTDSTFCEAQLILCRNVLIYFSRELQNRAFGLFTRSLAPRCFLGIGSKESLRFSNDWPRYEEAVEGQNVYRLRAASVLGGAR